MGRYKVEWCGYKDHPKVSITDTTTGVHSPWFYSYFLTGRDGWTVEMIADAIPAIDGDRDELIADLNALRAAYRLLEGKIPLPERET